MSSEMPERIYAMPSPILGMPSIVALVPNNDDLFAEHWAEYILVTTYEAKIERLEKRLKGLTQSVRDYAYPNAHFLSDDI